MKSGFWYFDRYLGMLRNSKYKLLQEWTLLLKIQNKKINFHIFFTFIYRSEKMYQSARRMPVP